MPPSAAQETLPRRQANEQHPCSRRGRRSAPRTKQTLRKARQPVRGIAASTQARSGEILSAGAGETKRFVRRRPCQHLSAGGKTVRKGCESFGDNGNTSACIQSN